MFGPEEIEKQRCLVKTDNAFEDNLCIFLLQTATLPPLRLVHCDNIYNTFFKLCMYKFVFFFLLKEEDMIVVNLNNE